MKPHELPMFSRYFDGETPDPTLIGSGNFVSSFVRLARNEPTSAADLVRSLMGHSQWCTTRARRVPPEDIARFINTGSRYEILTRALVAAAISESIYAPQVAFHLVTGYFKSQSLRTLRKFIRELESTADDSDGCLDMLIEDLDLVRCDDCEEYEFRDCSRDVFRSYDDVCRSCIEDNYTYLDRYDAYVYSDDVRTALDEDGDEVEISRHDDYFRYSSSLDQYVHIDYEEEDPEPEIIQGYHSSKRRQVPRDDDWTKQYKRYLGVELEVDCSTVNHQAKAAILNDAINEGVIGNKVFFERDGSVPGGFEIISQPMSLPAQRQLWTWLNNKDLIRSLKSHNTTNCGLHVHVSRQGLTPLQIAKIVAFVNSPDNEPLIRAIARRYAEGYCRIKEKKLGSAYVSSDRYEAVNVTGDKTLEFRIFKGSLKYESVIAAIEFANAMVEFTRPFGDCSAQNLRTDAFMEFINRKLTAETKVLRAYIANRLETA